MGWLAPDHRGAISTTNSETDQAQAHEHRGARLGVLSQGDDCGDICGAVREPAPTVRVLPILTPCDGIVAGLPDREVAATQGVIA